jgi:hypothetical protein
VIPLAGCSPGLSFYAEGKGTRSSWGAARSILQYTWCTTHAYKYAVLHAYMNYRTQDWKTRRTRRLRNCKTRKTASLKLSKPYLQPGRQIMSPTA